VSRRFYRVDSQYELRAFLDHGQTANDENRWTFEIAWEAANKGSTISNEFVQSRSKSFQMTNAPNRNLDLKNDSKCPNVTE
jgi:glycogen synthase